MRSVLIIAISGMELSWLYAWFNYLCLCLLGQNGPVVPMSFCFIIGAAVTGLIRGRGLRMITLFGIELLGLLLALFLLLGYFHASGYPLFHFGWILSLFSSSHSPLFWLYFVFETVMASLYWLSGVALARRKKDYESTAKHFDIGLSLIFALFIIKFLTRVKFETEIYDPGAIIFMFGFSL